MRLASYPENSFFDISHGKACFCRTRFLPGIKQIQLERNFEARAFAWAKDLIESTSAVWMQLK